MNIKLLPKHLRPREKLISNGPEYLKDRELLAILLRTGRSGRSAIEIAQDILKKHPTSTLLQTSLDQLTKIKGVDAGKACTIVAAFELTKRALALNQTSLPLVSNPEEALVHLSQIRKLKREHFIVLYLNARNQLIFQDTISIGTLTASMVHPREVFAPALEVRAVSIILSHNHPSGDPQPSPQDIELTQRLVEAGDILAIEVLDHLIVSSNEYSSLKQLSLM